MNRKLLSLFCIFIGILFVLSGCSRPVSINSKDKLNIVATTTMLADLTRVIGGVHVSADGLMGPGIDPHLYQASAGDVTLMQKADLVVYNGLHLEGKMGEIFESLTSSGRKIIRIEDGLDKAKLLKSETDSNIYDPHIWFDVANWKEAAKLLTEGLSEFRPEYSSDFQANLEVYLKELDELDNYIKNRTSEIPEGQRVLVTAHDAFRYFGKAYGYEVKGLQGISTDAEAGTSDVSSLAQFITERKIKAIFVESSVPPKTIEALQSAVKAKGFQVLIGGQLYSDSLGDKNSGDDTYILTFRANIDTIVDALK